MKFKFDKKLPKTKIFHYEVDACFTPDRNELYYSDCIDVHFCCNQFKIIHSWNTGEQYELSWNLFMKKYPDIFKTFMTEFKTYKAI